MKQEYELGKFLKDRYVTELLNSSYLFKEVEIFFETFVIIHHLVYSPCQNAWETFPFFYKKVFQFTPFSCGQCGM